MTYVIDGEIEVQADGHRSRVRSGGMSFVPKGVAHAFIVVSAEARLITMQSPGAVGQAFYRRASEPAVDDTVDRLDLDRLQAAAAANPRGITILGPPPFTHLSHSLNRGPGRRARGVPTHRVDGTYGPVGGARQR